MSNYFEMKDLMQVVTDILIENGCTINRPAVVKLTQLMVNRETNLVQAIQERQNKEYDRLTREINEPTFTGLLATPTPSEDKTG